MDQGDDPYQLLGIAKDATESDIKKAYRKLALDCHPDRQTDEDARAKAQHRFARIAGAYEILMDEDQRKEYDRQQRSGGGHGFDYNNTDIQFNDPYEVFKRNFFDEFGFEYPGAKYDFKDVPEHLRVKNKAKNIKLLTNGESEEDVESDDEEPSNGKKKDKKSKKKSKKDGSKKNSSALTLFKGKHLAKREESETQLANRAQQEPNNRPTSMETSTKKIEHDDGTIETITEIKITRPDGSTETCRTSDKADKRPGWKGKNKNKPKLLTNGEKPRGLLGNGKKTLLLTNGKTKTKPVTSKNGVLVPFEKNPEQPKRRGILGGWGRK